MFRLARLVGLHNAVLCMGVLWLLYLVSPLDLFPDVIPYIGRLDDLLALAAVYVLTQRLRARMARPGATTGARAGGHQASAGATGQQEGPAATVEESPTMDPWQVLQISPGASAEEIHAAYKTLLLQYHPDRVAHLGGELQALAHRKTLAIQRAYDMVKRQ
jgi:DnaJ-domain-containing protein 1